MLQLRQPELLLPLPGVFRVHRRRPAATPGGAPVGGDRHHGGAPRRRRRSPGPSPHPASGRRPRSGPRCAWLGTPYAWGGGNSQGPTLGIRDGCSQRCQVYRDWTITGFDCSGLTLYAWAQAGIALAHGSYYQVNQGRQLPYTQAQPGDLLFWGGTQIHHVALYLGTDQWPGTTWSRHPRAATTCKVSAVRTGGDFNNIAVRL